MSKKYCYCGKENDLLANFCMSCGKSFVKLNEVKGSTQQTPVLSNEKPLTSNPIKPKKSSVFSSNLNKRDDDDEDDEDSGDGEYVPNIDKLEVDISVDPLNTVKIGELMPGGSNASAAKLYANKSDNIKVDKKSILKEFQREAGALRPKK